MKVVSAMCMCVLLAGCAPATRSFVAHTPPGKAEVVKIITDAAHRNNVPPTLALAVARQESGFKTHVVSYQGAVGLMQVLPDTARAIGCARTRAELFDAYTAADCGTRYLRMGLDAAGSYHGAAAFYHGGPNLAYHGRKTAQYAAIVSRAAHEMEQ